MTEGQKATRIQLINDGWSLVQRFGGLEMFKKDNAVILWNPTTELIVVFYANEKKEWRK